MQALAIAFHGAANIKSSNPKKKPLCKNLIFISIKIPYELIIGNFTNRTQEVF